MTTDLSARGDPAGPPIGDVSVAHPLRGRIRRTPVPRSAGGPPPEAAVPARISFALQVDESLAAAGRFSPGDLAALRRGARSLLRARGWTIAADRGQGGASVEARISIQPMPIATESPGVPGPRVLLGLQAIVTPEAAAVARMRQLRDYTIVRLDLPGTGRADAVRVRSVIDAVVGRWLSRVF